jgi:hypothetical protein
LSLEREILAVLLSKGFSESSSGALAPKLAALLPGRGKAEAADVLSLTEEDLSAAGVRPVEIRRLLGMVRACARPCALPCACLLDPGDPGCERRGKYSTWRSTRAPSLQPASAIPHPFAFPPLPPQIAARVPAQAPTSVPNGLQALLHHKAASGLGADVLLNLAGPLRCATAADVAALLRTEEGVRAAADAGIPRIAARRLIRAAAAVLDAQSPGGGGGAGAGAGAGGGGGAGGDLDTGSSPHSGALAVATDEPLRYGRPSGQGPVLILQARRGVSSLPPGVLYFVAARPEEPLHVICGTLAAIGPVPFRPVPSLLPALPAAPRRGGTSRSGGATP